MSMIDDIVHFIRARNNEDLEHAHKDVYMAGSIDLPYSELREIDNPRPIGVFTGSHHRQRASLASRFQPANVYSRGIAQINACKAITRLVDSYGATRAESDATRGTGRMSPISVMAQVAGTWKHHPDYKTEWENV